MCDTSATTAIGDRAGLKYLKLLITILSPSKIVFFITAIQNYCRKQIEILLLSVYMCFHLIRQLSTDIFFFFIHSHLSNPRVTYSAGEFISWVIPEIKDQSENRVYHLFCFCPKISLSQLIKQNKTLKFWETLPL